MSEKIKITLVLTTVLWLASLSCKKDSAVQIQKIYTLQESFQTERNQAEDYDSPAVWHGPDQQNWIMADQSHQNNLFHVFVRTTFVYVGSFCAENTTNTDGVWLTQKAFHHFSNGAFYAVHNDGNVSAFDWRTIADSLNLNFF